MRISTASVIIAALCLGTPALVQAQGAQPKAPPQAPSEQSIVIRSIQIVNVKDLKPEVRSKVEDLAAKTSESAITSGVDRRDTGGGIRAQVQGTEFVTSCRCQYR